MIPAPRPGDQAPPQPAPGPDIQSLVIGDLQERHELGRARYGTGLKAFNGRNTLRDLYEELIDAVMYTRQKMEEESVTANAEAVTPDVDDLDNHPDMDHLEFRDDMKVELIQAMASDASVVAAARVSTKGDQSGLEGRELLAGSSEDHLIRYLMKARHGTPFEHNVMTFFVQAPIFVFRELMRHRIASYNEESGRYRELKPIFYLPREDRSLIQVGKAGHYTFEMGNLEQWGLTQEAGRRAARLAYTEYRRQLDAGIAREVARMVLPLSIYSSAYVTINARSLMNLLSLRIKKEGATFPSFPQREIEMVAERMEEAWGRLMPLTHMAYGASGRVAP